MNSVATVFVVDDDEQIRTALHRLIRSVKLDVEAYASAQEFLDRYDPNCPGCLVLDVRMPGLSGLALQDTLVAGNINVPIIFITAYSDVSVGVQAMKSGAVDFITKPFNDQILLDAIQRGIARDIQMRRHAVRKTDVRGRVDRLTPREQEVLSLVVVGKPNKQIAYELGISEKTIKVHRSHVMEKMQAGSLPDLVLLAQAAGICGATT